VQLSSLDLSTWTTWRLQAYPACIEPDCQEYSAGTLLKVHPDTREDPEDCQSVFFGRSLIEIIAVWVGKDIAFISVCRPTKKFSGGAMYVPSAATIG
jgi:hypothetical protein